MVNQRGPQLQAVYDAAKLHAQRSRGPTATETDRYQPKESDLPMVSPELTSELLHCLSTLPDPWPLAKITINMDSSSQWVSKMCRLFFADEYARRTVGTPTASLIPDMESAFQAVQNALPKLETRIIEFLSECLVTLLMRAKHVLETRSPHLSFMLLKEYWFRELYLGLKVTASFDRTESCVRVIDGQVRCITPDFKPKDMHVACYCICSCMDGPSHLPQPSAREHQKCKLQQQHGSQIHTTHLVRGHNSHQETGTGHPARAIRIHARLKIND